MKEIYLKESDCLSDEETEKLKGTFLDDSHWNILCQNEDTKVYKPNGSVLLVYLKKILPASLCKKAWPSLREAWSQSQNRGIAAGLLPADVKLAHGNRVKKAAPGFSTAMRARPLKEDGTVSNTNYAQQVDSGIIGFMDRNARFPYCRQTAFTMKEVEKWNSALPFIRAVDKVCEKYAPKCHAAQKEMINKTSPDFVIEGTSFTTVTVNHNWQCVDEKTECLSKTMGWIRYNELEVGDYILAYNSSSQSTHWEQVNNVYVDEKYEGLMMEFTHKGGVNKGFSALTTLDHRWPLRNLVTDEDRTYYSNKIPDGLRFMRGAPHDGPIEEVYSDNFVRVCAWYMTEGCLGWPNAIGISQSHKKNMDKVIRIRSDVIGIGAKHDSEWPLVCDVEGCGNISVCREMCGKHYRGEIFRQKESGEYVSRLNKGKRGRKGLWYRETLRKDGITIFGLRGELVSKILECIVGKEKIPSQEFLTSLSTRQARIFVDTCMDGDGYRKQKRFYQFNKKRLDAYYTAAVLAGMYPSSNTNYCYVGEKTYFICTDNVKKKLVDFKGVIWCPTIESGYWVARRNGKTFITGNTAVHVDKGDYQHGCGVLSALCSGKFIGGFYTYPKYKVAADLRTRDVILADVHSWHGNTPIIGIKGNFERISCVFYYRSNMFECGRVAEELERVKHRKIRGGEPVNG